MADRYLKPYLDANVWLGWIKGEVIAGVDRGAIAEHILTLAESKVFRVYTSAITLAEVHKLRSGPILAGDSADQLLAYMEHEFIEIIDVDRRIGEEAHRLCRQFEIYPNDGIHLACALSEGCDVLLAWDNRFIKVTHPSIRLEEPQRIGQAFMQGMRDT